MASVNISQRFLIGSRIYVQDVSHPNKSVVVYFRTKIYGNKVFSDLPRLQRKVWIGSKDFEIGEEAEICWGKLKSGKVVVAPLPKPCRVLGVGFSMFPQAYQGLFVHVLGFLIIDKGRDLCFVCGQGCWVSVWIGMTGGGLDMPRGGRGQTGLLYPSSDVIMFTQLTSQSVSQLISLSVSQSQPVSRSQLTSQSGSLISQPVYQSVRPSISQ